VFPKNASKNKKCTPLKIKNVVVTIKSRLYFIETTASTVDKKNPALLYFK